MNRTQDASLYRVPQSRVLDLEFGVRPRRRQRPLPRYDRDAVSDPSRTLSVSEGKIPPTLSGVIQKAASDSSGNVSSVPR